jgi:hypothetical protein
VLGWRERVIAGIGTGTRVLSARRGRGGNSADGGEDDVGGVAGAAFEIAGAEVTFGLQVERESTNETARFGVLKRQILAISNAPASEKQTPAQSLRGLFTDDVFGHGAMILWWPIRPTPKE